MAEITGRTVILLGGNVTVAASSDLDASADFAGAAFAILDGAATLSFDSAVSSSYSTTTQGSATLDAGSIIASSPGAFRFGTAALASQASLAADGQWLAFAPVDPLSEVSDLTAAGGVQYDAGTISLASEANVLPGVPGILVDADAVELSATASALISAAPVYRLILPTEQQSIVEDPFWSRFPIDVGVALLVTAGQGTLSMYPSQEELDAADLYFLGGYRHQISPAERSVILSAGFGSLIEEA